MFGETRYIRGVVSLPMRDGNCRTCFPDVLAEVVVSLPMRDGNSSPGTQTRSSSWVVSLPMRDGNLGLRSEFDIVDRLLAYL